jgi:hypothetical protein
LRICRAALLLLRKCRGAAGLGELQLARGQKVVLRDHTRPHPAHFTRRPQLERSKWQINSKPLSGSRQRATGISHFPFENCHTEFAAFLRAFPPYFSRVLSTYRLLLGTRWHKIMGGGVRRARNRRRRRVLRRQ